MLSVDSVLMNDSYKRTLAASAALSKAGYIGCSSLSKGSHLASVHLCLVGLIKVPWRVSAGSSVCSWQSDCTSSCETSQHDEHAAVPFLISQLDRSQPSKVFSFEGTVRSMG
jgi:hypothetical protein